MKPTEKLQKVLARSGHGSRRELERMISEGRVRVDDHVATLGERVSDDATIRIDGHRVTVKAADELPCRVLIYHKPEGELVTRKDPEGRPTVYDRMPRLKGARWIAVGRLDINTSGLLLLTTDGELANQLMHPRSEVEREYAVRVFGEVTDKQIQAMKKGVELEDGPAHFKRVSKGGGEGMNQWFHVVLTEGRNREVRRIWESQGLQVNRLIRVRMGALALPKGLVQGGYVELGVDDVNYLRKLVKLPATESAPVITDKEQERQIKQARRAGRKKREAPARGKPAGGNPGSRKPVGRKPAGGKPAGGKPAGGKPRSRKGTS